MTFDLVINYSRAANRFIEMNPKQLSFRKMEELLEKAFKKLNGIEINVDVCEMKGFRYKYYRLRKGKIRILFTYEKGIIHIVNVEDIGFRGDVYK